MIFGGIGGIGEGGIGAIFIFNNWVLLCSSVEALKSNSNRFYFKWNFFYSNLIQWETICAVITTTFEMQLLFTLACSLFCRTQSITTSVSNTNENIKHMHSWLMMITNTQAKDDWKYGKLLTKSDEHTSRHLFVPFLGPINSM